MGENKSFRRAYLLDLPSFYQKVVGGTGATPLCNLKRKTKRTVALFRASAVVRQYHFPKGNILGARLFEDGCGGKLTKADVLAPTLWGKIKNKNKTPAFGPEFCCILERERGKEEE